MKLFRLKPSPSTFVIQSVSTEDEGFRLSAPLTPHSLPLPNRVSEDCNERFLIAYRILYIAEPSLRQSIDRLLTPGVRNMPLTIPDCFSSLKRFMTMHPSLFRRPPMTHPEFHQLIHATLAPLRHELGLPDSNPIDCCYEITPEVFAATADPALRTYLNDRHRSGALTPQDFESVRRDLNENFPNDASTVIAALRLTQSRDHLSALSLSSSDDQLLVTLVDPAGHRLTLEGFKFIDLLRNHDTTRRLHLFQRNASRTDFVFDQQTKGEILGRFHAAHSTLNVACYDPIPTSDSPGRSPTAQASFVIDVDYALMVFLALDRLLADRERFARLLEHTQSHISFDLLAEFPQLPITTRRMS